MRPGQTGFADFFLHIFLTPAVPVAAKHAPKQQCLQLTAAGTQIFFGRRVTAKRQSKQRTEGFFSIAKQQNNNASQQRLTEKSIFTAGSLPAQKRPFDKLGKMVTPETAEKCQT